MNTVNKLFLVISFVIFMADTTHAEVIDLTSVTLSGSNPYTFNDPNLGTVTLTYSGNIHDTIFGIVSNYGGINTIGVGQDDGSGKGLLDITWTNPITSLDFRVYDLDLSEQMEFELPAGTTLSLISANPLINNSLSGNVLSAGSGIGNNADLNNYSELQVSGAPFTSLGTKFQRLGLNSGAGGIGFGATVPEPVSGILLFACLLAIKGSRKRA